MFKVECPGCQAPYQVDERRVPTAGLRMRCPKCSHTFRVHQPGKETSPTALLDNQLKKDAAPPPPPRRPKVGKGTMIGVAAHSGAAAGPPPLVRDRKKFAGTVIGVPAPAVAGKSSGGESDQALTMRPEPPNEPDLPAVLSKKPSRVDLPEVRSAPKGAASKSSLDEQLPVAREALPTPVPRRQSDEALSLSLELGDDLLSSGAPLESPLPEGPPSVPLGEKESQEFPGAVGLVGSTRLAIAGSGSGSTSDAPRDSLELPSPVADFGADLSAGLTLDGGAFGEIDLPVASEQSARATARSVSAVPRVRRSSFPPENPFEEAFSLPELDAPQPLAPKTSFSDSFPGFDTAFDEAGPLSTRAGAEGVGPASVRPAGAVDEDAFDALPDALGLQESANSGETKTGTQYGEVDLGDVAEDGQRLDSPSSDKRGFDTDDGMEFGAIPQEAERPAETAVETPTVAEPVPESLPVPSRVAPASRGVVARAESAPPKKRRWAVALGGLLLLGIAGGALALVPDLGPFGSYYVSDLLNRGAHEQRLVALQKAYEEQRSKDTWTRSKQGLLALEQAAAELPRFRPLAAYLAFAEYAHVLRFGSDSLLQAQAKVLLDRLAQAGVDAGQREYRLARALQLASDGELEKAQTAMERALQGSSPSVLGLAVLGEIELLRKNAQGANKAWLRAAEVSANAWTQFGLARSASLAGDAPKAKELLETVLTLSPEHNGARLLLAELLWKDKEEARATKYLQEVFVQEKKSNPGEQQHAHILMGEIHLGRGRLSKAETEFETALKIDAKDYRALLDLGDTFFAAGRYTAALARYEAAASASADSVLAELGVAKAQLSMDRVNDALTSLSKLQKTHPKNPNVAYWLARSAEASGKRDVAKGAYQLAIKEGANGPEAALAFVGLAQLLGQEGKLEEAGALLKEALGKLPDSALLRKALGDVALSQGRYEQALSEFRAAHKLDPQDVTALFNVGSSLRRLSRFDQALEIFEQVAKMDKDLPGLPLERGLLLEQSGRADEALKEYEAALSKAPEDPDLMLRVGCARVVAGDGKAGQPMLQKVLEKRPRSAEGHHCLGRAFFLQEKYVEALQSLQRATSLDPNRAEYYVYTARVANAAGQVALAEQAIDTALQKDQGLGDAYWQKGVLLLRQGAALDALAALDKALELRPSRYEVHADRAQAYYQVGKELPALAEWEKAIAHDGDNATWRFRYGKLLAARRKNADAVSHLEKAIELSESAESSPGWLWQAHHLLAVALGPTQAALPHWRRFLELSPENSPYRDEAKKALARAGQAWTGP